MHFSNCNRCDWTCKKTVQFFHCTCLEINGKRKLTEIFDLFFVDFNNVLGSYNEGYSEHIHQKNPVHYLHKYMCTPTQVFILDIEHTLFGP